MFSDDELKAASELLDACRKSGLRVATAESCTGGLVAGLLTAVPGSSHVVERGFVTYTNEAKHQMLDVPEQLFIDHGAVSEPVARAMAEGVLRHSDADVSVAVTGIAGPGGETETKPIGLVHIASARAGNNTLHEWHIFEGDRHAVRMQAVDAAVALLRRQAG